MRYSQLISEAVDQENILNDLEELIVRNKARGFTKISTPMLKGKLEAQGYSVDMTSLLDLLRTISSVGSATAETVTFDNALPDQSAAKKDDTVSKLASKQLTKKERKL
jgi:hypothetical protein